MKKAKSTKRREKGARNRVSVAAVLLTVSCGSLLGLVRVYDVAPVKASWSGWTHRGDAISEVITCNFDSVVYCELFAGETLSGRNYKVDVYELPDGTDRVAYNEGEHAAQPQSWVRIPLTTVSGKTFTKGKQYEFKFTCGGNDRLEYNCQLGDPYPYGVMLVPGQPTQVDRDLAARVYGRMNAVSDSLWGAKTVWPYWSNGPKWTARTEEAGLKIATFEFNWSHIERTQDDYDFGGCDSAEKWLLDSAKVAIVGTFVACPSWASSCINNYTVRQQGGRDTCHHCPPRGLWASGDVNLWSRFVDTCVRRYDGIHTWECWNEPNSNCTTLVEPDQKDIGGQWGAGWWRYPNIDSIYYGIDNIRELCSLYVQLCWVTTDAIRSVEGHDSDRILIGALWRVTGSWEDPFEARIGKGQDWLRMCYDIATGPGGHGVFWDGVSVHAYPDAAWGLRFPSETFEAEAETLQTIMRAHDHHGELWNTEVGWDRSDASTDRKRAADNLSQVYVRSLAAQALPGGGYDRACWWAFNELLPEFGSYAMLDSALNPYAGFFAFKQACTRLTGQRINRRVISGDTTTDRLVQIYEFDDTATLRRTWVCWEDADTKHDIRVKLPVRTDQMTTESLAYSSTTPKFSPKTSSDGWLTLDLDERPVFITEIGAPSRPDLRVDSVRYEQAERVVRAWVTNHGTRATPVRSGRRAYPTWAVLKADGDSLAQAVWSKEIGINQGAEFGFELDRTELPDTVLLSVNVNPSQTFVELETDDNIGYTLKVGR